MLKKKKSQVIIVSAIVVSEKTVRRSKKNAKIHIKKATVFARTPNKKDSCPRPHTALIIQDTGEMQQRRLLLNLRKKCVGQQICQKKSTFPPRIPHFSNSRDTKSGVGKETLRKGKKTVSKCSIFFLRRRKRKVRTTCNVAIFYLLNEVTEIRDDVIAIFLELPQILTVGRWGSYSSQDSLSAASLPPLHMFLKNCVPLLPLFIIVQNAKTMSVYLCRKQPSTIESSSKT